MYINGGLVAAVRYILQTDHEYKLMSCNICHEAFATFAGVEHCKKQCAL